MSRLTEGYLKYCKEVEEIEKSKEIREIKQLLKTTNNEVLKYLSDEVRIKLAKCGDMDILDLLVFDSF